ncbi:uncharacterized protein LOC127249451 isoform X2 [Andrographis paniculata]|uniref:uncharacterized protein LOC127249451 isoform X2 n=1 Tax=Andrographis paniculata TaxID=175694 RepID=UPI0021E98568|nr:uncharacterized protein LOC127249451 isoform X2 [Andrographis paniculata]XP_051128179.1 uncharacterized protein LOC127249451 isoform X2 [Andrographis paniculata]
MTQHFRSKLEDMNGSDNPMSNCQGGDVVNQRTSVSDHVNGLQHSTARSDVFVVNMERFSHIVEKDINANSRIALQRSLSRKGPARTGEKKISVNDRDSNTLSSSPRATLHESSMLEKATMADHPQVHHQITIGNNGTAAASAESKLLSGGRRFSFRRSTHTWIIDPRKILFFFATLSCMGTVVLIYFTLSMGKPSGDDNAALN